MVNFELDRSQNNSTFSVHHSTIALKPSAFDSLHRFSQSLFRCTHGHPDIPFARGAEAVPRCRHDPGLFQQVSREGCRGVSLRHRDPDVERSRWRIHFQPKLLEAWDEGVAPLLLDLAQAIRHGVIQAERGNAGFLNSLETAGV